VWTERPCRPGYYRRFGASQQPKILRNQPRPTFRPGNAEVTAVP
jgi:hypothetical protein